MSNVIKSNQVIETKIKKDVILSSQKDNSALTIEKTIQEAKEKYNQILKEANEKANKIIEDAEKKADSILEETYIETKSIIEESKEKGFEEGYKKGFSEGKEKADRLIKEANEIKKEYLLKKKEVLGSLEKDLIDLTITICEKILCQKVDNDKEILINVIKDGLEKLAVSDEVMLRVSNDDYDFILESKDRILAMASLVEDIDIKLDNNLARGDCIIETSKGNADISLSTQIEEMKNLLYNLLNGE
ncbi:FliH/SctL family protein [Thermohalobacter berrensis]|uniref:Flagellar assembly protein FliH/Type III secretion system HrpE domain-containing protein n=1 Tax=Thermohalobacter berrensis TaxID=99594 RepID=A0A419TAC2_9FIRM|nr:FliH/SctL family protein [Thermohalobacter berrensis]RKD34434.1 hypothetical protein BET03_00960 [Thermohalobacter berrensis]